MLLQADALGLKRNRKLLSSFRNIWTGGDGGCICYPAELGSRGTELFVVATLVVSWSGLSSVARCVVWASFRMLFLIVVFIYNIEITRESAVSRTMFLFH